MRELSFAGQLDIFSIRENRYLRTCGDRGELSGLGQDEYFCFSLLIRNHGTQTFTWQQAQVSVDGAPPKRWAKGQLPPAGCARFRLSYGDMKPWLTPGVHTVVWYLDGQPVCRERFLLDRRMDWKAVFPMPTRQQIAAYRNPRNVRSPYLAAWLQIPDTTRYTEYTVEFKAEHVPNGTYFCLGCWRMDLSCLKQKFRQVRSETQWTNAYAGFQKLHDGRTVSIMSFWDVFCMDARGRETTLRAKRLYPPEVIGGGEFGGEGTGARSTAPFDWKADHWYRMHLKCVPSPGNGNTLVEQWVCDLQTQEEKLLCRYDTGLTASAFVGQTVPFLENFLPETAGQIRSMELRSPRYRDAETGKWCAVTGVYITPQSGLPQYEGSYRFGVSDGKLWMITSGVGGDWFHNGKGQKGETFSLV